MFANFVIIMQLIRSDVDNCIILQILSDNLAATLLYVYDFSLTAGKV